MFEGIMRGLSDAVKNLRGNRPVEFDGQAACEYPHHVTRRLADCHQCADGGLD